MNDQPGGQQLDTKANGELKNAEVESANLLEEQKVTTNQVNYFIWLCLSYL